MLWYTYYGIPLTLHCYFVTHFHCWFLYLVFHVILINISFCIRLWHLFLLSICSVHMDFYSVSSWNVMVWYVIEWNRSGNVNVHACASYAAMPLLCSSISVCHAVLMLAVLVHCLLLRFKWEDVCGVALILLFVVPLLCMMSVSMSDPYSCWENIASRDCMHIEGAPCYVLRHSEKE